MLNRPHLARVSGNNWVCRIICPRVSHCPPFPQKALLWPEPSNPTCIPHHRPARGSFTKAQPASHSQSPPAQHRGMRQWESPCSPPTWVRRRREANRSVSGGLGSSSLLVAVPACTAVKSRKVSAAKRGFCCSTQDGQRLPSHGPQHPPSASSQKDPPPSMLVPWQPMHLWLADPSTLKEGSLTPLFDFRVPLHHTILSPLPTRGHKLLFPVLPSSLRLDSLTHMSFHHPLYMPPSGTPAPASSLPSASHTTTLLLPLSGGPHLLLILTGLAPSPHPGSAQGTSSEKPSLTSVCMSHDPD